MTTGSIDYLVIGHVALDVGAGPPRLGGTAYYAALTAQRLGQRAGMVTRCPRHVAALLHDALPSVALHVLPSAEATAFENIYEGDSRRQRLLARADDLDLSSIPSEWGDVPLVHLGPVAREVDPALLSAFPQSFIGVTPQGWLRRWGDDQIVGCAEPDFELARLGSASAVVFSEEDLCGNNELARRLAEAAPYSVQTRAGKAATLHSPRGPQRIAAHPTTVVDPTGAGDVFATAFFVRFAEGAAPDDAVRFAHVAAALSIAAPGSAAIPDRETIARILQHEERIANGA